MAKKTLYAYADGEKNGGATVHDPKVVEAVEKRLDALVSSRKWVSKDVWVVNQNEPPHWDLGLNLAVPTGKALSASFLEDVVAVANELGVLHRETQKRFVIGIHDAGTDETHDLFDVESSEPNRAAVEAAFRDALKIK